MNRREFLRMLSAFGATTAIASSMPTTAVSKSGNPWLKPRPIPEDGKYSKLIVEVHRTLREIYSDPQFAGAQLPIATIVGDQRIVLRFDVPHSRMHEYANRLGTASFLPMDVYPHINSLIVTDVRSNCKREGGAEITSELLDPGDGIDMGLIERIAINCAAIRGSPHWWPSRIPNCSKKGLVRKATSTTTG